MGWLEWVELAALLLLLLVVLPLAFMFARRRWLSAKGGVFDCAMRVRDIASGGWALGLARYEADRLEWYRAFSLRFTPTVQLERNSTSVVSHRDPDQVEALVLFAEHQVVKLHDATRQRDVELAMTPGSVTGLMSWLEASPPGRGRYPGVE
ncbi:DUF2550 domain-containing protein [Aestuariimicrobium ganziense]|uniref:DUF2550 domain-containing protein n=1 Tax=Aestuariimicrobium ganziense TaxID=2773677 RepID=UPI001942376F|nr:DUF2550 domain-containing protein [Aestuariimicrobium ganziense]